MLFDAHAHLQAEFSEPSRAWLQADMSGVVLTAVHPKEASELRQLAPQLAQSRGQGEAAVWLTVGLHPFALALLSGEQTKQAIDDLERGLQADGLRHFAAVGECGLDRRSRWRLHQGLFERFAQSPGEGSFGEAKNPSSEMHGLQVPAASLQLQLEVLRAQLALAQRYDRPVVLHCVDAHGALLGLLREFHMAPSIIHGFSGGWQLAQEYLRLGHALSLGASILDPRAKKLQLVAQCLPAESLLVESDAPSRRGPTADRSLLSEVYTRVAQLRNSSVEHLAAQVGTNLRRLLGTPVSGSQTRA